jgi:hypothetical protein
MEKKLEELKNLLDSGAITESEYQELKKKLLDENVEVEKQNESSVTESIEEDLFEDLIAKYNPNEKDLFLISFMQDKIITSSSIFMSSKFFEKQELKAKVLKLLKPYKVKFMDLGELIPQIAEKKYHLNKELQEKYDTNEIESITISPLSKALNNAYSIIILWVLAGLFGWFVLGPIINGEDFFWENKDPNASHIISDEEIEDDEVYEDMYSEEDYEDHPEEENTDLLYPQTSDEDEIHDYYEVYNTYLDEEDYLNLRSEPTSKSTNITRMTDGTKLILLSKGNGSNGKWMKVRVLESGKVGYAHSKWIRKINEE